ncbi:hypothetical protein B7P43_G12898 [Cryptotermes secundus]|uniref:TERF2-interacting telomeric protein 1 Myb domain-containing protein n=1 Tax=Cryptotermes secundus TaxID=105785 RepID=A0A2J7RPY3_9NEOP|nr:hypothetical protein B7P43_G12898 [Cryptotermes secundus]
MMEEKMVCNKRTWQSMKEQFFKKILPDIESFNLSESQISRFKNLKSSNSLRHWERQSLKSSALEEPSDQLNRRTDSSTKDNHKQNNLYIEPQGNENEPCFLRNANYYTEAEDKALLNFVVQRERYSETGGVRLWKLMERKQVLPGRSWQSMKERYRKVLTRKLDQYLPSDVVNQIMKAEIRGSKWKMKKRKPSVAACMLSPRSHEIYSMQMTEPESDISKTQPNCLALDCTCCSNSSTNTSIKSIKSTVPVVSGTPNKREPPKNPIHSPKRKLFSQRKSLVEFTPVSEDKRRKQSSKYIYKPNLQIHHLTKGNRKRDAKGCNRVTKVAAVANAQKESQPNEDMAPYGTRKSDVVVCNTKCTCQGIGTHQKNSGGSFAEEITNKESHTLVSEGDLLKLRGASENSILDDNVVHINNEANKNYQELQISRTRVDSLMCLLRSSSSESHLDIISGEETEFELNVPTCPDSAQEILHVHEEEMGSNDLSFGVQTALNKKGKINGMSVEGGNEGETLNNHERISDKREEGQGTSCAHILKDRSVMEELSCGKPQDKEISEKSSCELNLADSSYKQSLLKNDHSIHKVTVCPKTQSGDKHSVTKSLSQSSCFEGCESHSCIHDNTLNGEDIGSRENGPNILLLKHSIPDCQNSNGKLTETNGNEGEEVDEECIEKYLNLNLMQSWREENEIGNGKVGTDGNREDGSDIPIPDMYKVYGENGAYLNVSNSIKNILNDSVCIFKDNQFEILDIPDFISIRADGNQQESGTGDSEHGSKETPRTRIVSANSSRTTDNTNHDILLAQPDATVSHSTKVLYHPAGKKIPSVRQNRHTVCTELGEERLIGPLPTESDKKSGQNQTQAALPNGLGTGQTIETRCNNKSLISGRNNQNGKFLLSTQVTENDDKHLLEADSSLLKSGKNTIIKKCKQNKDCVSSIHAKEKILDDLLSQRQGATSESRCTGFAAQTMDATSECEEVRNLEQPVSSEHQGNSTDWFESSTDNSDSPVQESGSSGHDLHEACCSLTASTISTDDSCAMFSHSNAYKKLRKKRWKETADCSICDRTQNMEPCMPDI